ncbi:MAG: rhomboid family intramembrane serine protease, partial [Polyangiaceae bacterium]
MHSLVPDPPDPPPRPVSSPPIDDGRLVSRGWLEPAPVTRALLTMNVAVFVVQLVFTAGKSLSHLPPREALAFGASDSLATVFEHRWETLVTACFLHDGVLHLGFNMLALWQAGPLVERNVGSARMAPMYLVAGAFGNLVSVANAWREHGQSTIVGASGAISGLLAAALVVGWRVQGFRGPLAQAMLRWLVFVLTFGFLERWLNGAHIANDAHVGGAIAGALIAWMWRRRFRYSEQATRFVVAGCVGILAGCIALVGWHDRTDPFATMNLEARAHKAETDVALGRCKDAHDDLLAVERLRRSFAPTRNLRAMVEESCGHVG